jgi:N-terminal domain of toast_rack, DUF2154
MNNLEEKMNRKMVFLAIVMLAIVSLACSVNINLPSTQVKTGPTVTENINVPLLADPQATADITIKFGAGTLNIQPGAQNALVEGTASYNVADFKPDVTVNGSNIDITQGNLDVKEIPSFKKDIVNDWKLSLGNTPINLVINAGAYEGTYELGGLSIQSLEIGDGAAKVDVSFTNPNLIEMSSLTYSTGASEVSLKGLGNANTQEMTFRGGAGNYTLDFSGELRSNLNASIEAGVSQVTVIIPAGVNAQVITDTGLMTVSTDGSWQQNGNTYQLTGSGNTITIHVTMGAGSLKLETSNP